MKMVLRHLSHSEPAPTNRSVEELQTLIETLTAERQRLRLAQAPADELEQNRRAIAATQWELSYALIQRYHPSAA
jgi:hypothetical protein